MDLTKEKCVACEGWMKPLTREQFNPYLATVSNWQVLDDKKITKEFKFKNFKEALRFVDKVGETAETEGHHPDIFLHNWNKVTISLTTFALKGLSKNDFIMAAKIDTLSA